MCTFEVTIYACAHKTTTKVIKDPYCACIDKTDISDPEVLSIAHENPYCNDKAFKETKNDIDECEVCVNLKRFYEELKSKLNRELEGLADAEDAEQRRVLKGVEGGDAGDEGEEDGMATPRARG